MTGLDPQAATSSVRYAILGRLASGGMAELFLARATSNAGVERYVVIKRVLPGRLADPMFVAMFLDEARLAAQLHHHNIAQVFDLGRLGESYFFTLEYLHGEDLRALMGRLAALGRRLPIAYALYIASGVAAGLHYAHEKTGTDGVPLNIVHRDVSPANIMVSFEGAVKLLDFGIAKTAIRTADTQVGSVKGKVTYLSPEQCRGDEIDRRSDVFSLGIVLHEMLTGARLFRRDTEFDTMQAIVEDPILPPSHVRADVTPALDRVVMKALARDPAARYATAGEVGEAIDGVAIQKGWTMTASKLGRFLRDLFGERPEPWLELVTRDEQPSVVTVTSQSVEVPAFTSPSGELTAAEDDTSVEAQLARTMRLGPRSAIIDDYGDVPPDAPDARTTLERIPTPRPDPIEDRITTPLRAVGAADLEERVTISVRPVAASPSFTAFETVPDGQPLPDELSTPRPSEPDASAPRPSEPDASAPRPSEPRPSEPDASEPEPDDAVATRRFEARDVDAAVARARTTGSESAGELVRAIEEAGGAASPQGAPDPRESIAISADDEVHAMLAMRSRDRRGRIAIALVGVALLAGVGVVAAMHWRDLGGAASTGTPPPATAVAPPAPPVAPPKAAVPAAVPERPVPRPAADGIRAAHAQRRWSAALWDCAMLDPSARSIAASAELLQLCATAACAAQRATDAKRYIEALPLEAKAAAREACAARGVAIDP